MADGGPRAETLLLTPQEVAKKLHTSVRRIYQMCADEEITHVVISRRADGLPARLGITPEAVDAWIRRNTRVATVKRNA